MRGKVGAKNFMVAIEESDCSVDFCVGDAGRMYLLMWMSRGKQEMSTYGSFL